MRLYEVHEIDMKLREYISRMVSMISNQHPNHSFTDGNGTHHENGYKPKDKKSLIRLLRVLRRERGDEGDYNDIDVSEITDMSNLLDDSDFICFNGDITGWNTSSVRNMKYIFYGTTSFNRDISKWDVSRVECMGYETCFRLHRVC